MKSIRVFAVLCMAMLLCAPAFAQTGSTGAITGRAQDSSGAIIPGVEVTISSPAMIGGSRTEVTDEQGIYRFPLLAPGTYRVSFALPGFKTVNLEEVELNNGVTRTINGPMEVASSAEEVTVTSQAATIDLESATVNVNWSQKMMDELPWSRSLTGISMMIPSAFSTALDIGNSNFGTSSVIADRSGGRSGGTVVSIDGLAWCQTYSDYGTFEEMNISTNSKGADQMNSGVTIAMVTKTGGNAFHGNVTTAYQNGSFQSSNVDSTLLAEGYPLGSNKFTHFTDYYGDIGGPVLKDKLWFYIALRQAYQGTFIPGFVTAVGGVQTPFYTILRSPTAKFTYQLTAKQKLEAYMGIPDKDQPYRGGSNLEPQDATQDQDSWSSQGPVFTYTNIIDAKTSLTAKLARGGYWWPAYTYGVPSGLGPNIFNNGSISRIPTVNFLGVSNVGVHITDVTSTATDGAFASNYTRPIRWQENIDFSRFVNIGGKNNEMKIGYMGWRDTSYTINFGQPYQEQFRYKSLSTESCGSIATGDSGDICSNFFQHPNSVIVSDTPNNNVQGAGYKAVYFNDKITMSRKLTLNLGVRWDWSNSFLPAQGNDGSGPWATQFLIPSESSITNPDGSIATFPTYTLWSPRLSFAYDVMGNGKLAIKASAGRYIGITSSPNSTPGPGANSSGVDPIATTACTYNNWDGSIPFNPVPDFSGGVLGSPNANLSAPCQKSGRNAAGQVVAAGTYNFDSGLRPNYLNEYTFGVEYSPNRNYSFRAGIQRKFDIGGSVSTTPLLPMSAYSQETCVADPGRDGLTDTPGLAPVCTYNVPTTNPNRTVTNVLFKNYNLSTNEGTAAYTGYDFTFSKNYANRWSFLAGYGLSFARAAEPNPITPDQLLYFGNQVLGTWRNAIKMSGQYGLPDVPYWSGHKIGGIQWSSTYTAQSGDWYDRTADVTNGLGTKVTQDVDPHFGRYPWTKDWDQRITKRFKITDKQNVEVRWDQYNIMNANTVQTYGSIDSSSSTYFQSGVRAPGPVLAPKTILAPRIYEWGVSYRF